MSTQKYCQIFSLLVLVLVLILVSISNSVEIMTGCPFNHYSSSFMSTARTTLFHTHSDSAAALKDELLGIF